MGRGVIGKEGLDVCYAQATGYDGAIGRLRTRLMASEAVAEYVQQRDLSCALLRR